MNRLEFYYDDYLSKLDNEKKDKFLSLDKEKRHKIIEEYALGHQDDEMWRNDEGISRLEGRIDTNSFQ